MKKLADLKAQIPAMCAAAQRIYDEWDQDPETGEDPWYGSGGICDFIATDIVGVLDKAGIEAGTIHILDDNHTVVMAAVKEGVFHVDIPFENYERKKAYYNFAKIPNVTFTPKMVVIERVDTNPKKLDQYLEDG